MKARFAWLVAIWALAAALAGGGEPSRELRLCVLGGNYSLMDRRVRQVAAAAGLRISIHPLESSDDDDFLRRVAAYDGIAYAPGDLPMPVAEGQKGLVKVQEPLAQIRYQVYGREGAPRALGWESFAGQRVGVLAGGGGAQRRLPASAVVVPFADREALENAMRHHAIDFAVMRLLPGADPAPFFAGRPLAKQFREATPMHVWLRPPLAHFAGKLDAAIRAAAARGEGAPRVAANRRPRILYLHSYHLGRQWEDAAVAGVNSVLPENDYFVFHEFLDADRVVMTHAYQQERYGQLCRAYADNDLDLVMASGDEALDFVKQRYDGFFAGLPVAYCGVSGLRLPDPKDFPRFAGVAEAPSALETLRLALRAHPAAKRVYVVNDHTPFGEAWAAEIARQAEAAFTAEGRRLELDFAPATSLAGLRGEVRALPEGTVGLLGRFIADAAGNYVPLPQTAAVIGRSASAPFYSLVHLQDGYGVIGGKVVSAWEQGRQMAEVAKAILDGRQHPWEIYRRPATACNRWEFDGPSLAARGLGEKWLRDTARDVEGGRQEVGVVFRHMQEQFASRHPVAFWLLVGGGAASALLVLALLFHSRLQRDANARLSRQGEELRQQAAALEERAAMLEKRCGALEKQVAERDRFLEGLAERMRGAMRDSLEGGEAAAPAADGRAPGRGPALEELSAGICAMFDAVAGSAHQLALLFDTMSSGFVLNAAVVGPDGEAADYRILKVNPAAERLLGRPAEALVGRTYGELFPELRDKWLGMFTDVAMLNKVRRLEDYVPAFGHYLEVTAYSPKQAQCVCLLNDASDRHQAVQALVEARNAANEANMAKSNFLARMSHEIRTPMNAIIGLTNLLLPGRLDATQREYLEHILSASQTLLLLINETLDLSKIEAGKMELRPRQFSLSAFLDGVVNLIRPLADKKGLAVALDVAPDVPESLYGDAGKLHEVLINLCGNAVKFTDSGGVTISCAVQEKRENPDGAPPKCLLLFKVSDTGCGIAEDYLGRIFDPFSQEDETTTRVHDGTGLGLAICRSFVEMMGGAITVQSVKGRGSQFSFTVLLDEGPEKAAASAAVNLRDLRVLVADADALARESMARTLQHFGCRVLCVADGAAALAAADEAAAAGDPFRLLLLDCRLPEFSGPAAEGRLARLGGAGGEAPKVVMVVPDDAPAPAPGGPQSAGRVLNKPYTPSQLYDVMVASLMGAPALPAGASAGAAGDAAAGPLAPPDDPLAGLANWKVLLVEDNSLNRLVATELLKQCHVHCDVAVNGLDALATFQGGHYDLVFMDVQMPVMDGYEATRRLRELGFAGPVVAMTAHAMDGDMEKSLAAGMDVHLTKPIEPASLRAVLAKVLRDFPRRPMAPSELAGALAPGAAAGAPSGAAPTAPASATAPEPAPPLFAPDEGLRLCDHNRDLYARLLAVFLGEADGVAERLRAGFARRDAATAGRELHTLKSTAATLGAKRLSGMAARAEAAVKGGAWDEGALAGLLGALDATCAAMRQSGDGTVAGGAVAAGPGAGASPPAPAR